MKSSFFKKRLRCFFFLWLSVFLLSSAQARKTTKNEALQINYRVQFQTLLTEMKKSEREIIDLECLFLKQITKNNNEFPLSQIFYRYKKNPDTVFIQYLNRYEGRKLLYVSGQNDNKIVVRPEGFFSFTTIKVDPFSEKAMAEDLEPITKLNFHAIIDEMEKIYIQRLGNSTVEFKENDTEDGRPVYRLIIQEKQSSNYFNFAIDKQKVLPYKLYYKIDNNNPTWRLKIFG